VSAPSWDGVHMTRDYGYADGCDGLYRRIVILRRWRKDIEFYESSVANESDATMILLWKALPDMTELFTLDEEG